MTPREAFDAFAQRIYAQSPGILSVDLSSDVLQVVTPRGLCGEHGRVLPTRQKLCPRCAGFVLIPDQK